MAQELSAKPDPAFDHIADSVRRMLGVPIALVTILQADRQVFPGAAGLPEPWQTQRQTPLSYSFCRHVVADGAPLVISDARLEPRVWDNPAIAELGVVAYAGYPLQAGDGTTIGSICAIDTIPRPWLADELARLADLARTCGAELDQRHAGPTGNRSGPATDSDIDVDQSRQPGPVRAAGDFACVPSAVAEVRRWSRAQMSRLLAPVPVSTELVDSVELIVSELATNAVRAGSDRLTVTLTHDSAWVSVDVLDDAPGTPIELRPTDQDDHGRGLGIVSAVAADWGVRSDPLGKRVWATLPIA